MLFYTIEEKHQEAFLQDVEMDLVCLDTCTWKCPKQLVKRSASLRKFELSKRNKESFCVFQLKQRIGIHHIIRIWNFS